MANSSKSHFLISPYGTKSIQIQNSCIKASSSEELLGIKIDSNLTFHDHIISLCSKANKKLSALSRVSKYMGINKRRILMKSYIFSQFNYCPLVWMCHSRNLNNKINRIQERALRIVYRDYKSSFKELLQKDKSITIHQKNLQYLAIEIYKVKMGISPKIMNEIFRFSKNYVCSLRSGIQLKKSSINTVQFGSESTVYLRSKIWELIPENIKSSESVGIFKSKIKNWVPEV